LFGCGGGLGFPQPPSGVRAGQEEGGGGERHADGRGGTDCVRVLTWQDGASCE
jgi:hypothetical protein